MKFIIEKLHVINENGYEHEWRDVGLPLRPYRYVAEADIAALDRTGDYRAIPV